MTDIKDVTYILNIVIFGIAPMAMLDHKDITNQSVPNLCSLSSRSMFFMDHDQRINHDFYGPYRHESRRQGKCLISAVCKYRVPRTTGELPQKGSISWNLSPLSPYPVKPNIIAIILQYLDPI